MKRNLALFALGWATLYVSARNAQSVYDKAHKYIERTWPKKKGFNVTRVEAYKEEDIVQPDTVCWL